MTIGDTLKVPVVDDDQQMVKTICNILRVKGYEAVSRGKLRELLGEPGAIAAPTDTEG